LKNETIVSQRTGRGGAMQFMLKSFYDQLQGSFLVSQDTKENRKLENFENEVSASAMNGFFGDTEKRRWQ
jgi:hypothetical protein